MCVLGDSKDLCFGWTVLTRWPGGHAFAWFASIKSIRYWDGVKAWGGDLWMLACQSRERSSLWGSVDVSISVVAIAMIIQAILPVML